MNNSFVTDTMALVLYLENRKLPPLIKGIFKLAEANEHVILIPAIVLAEIGYLAERGKIEVNILTVGFYLKNFHSIQVADIGFSTLENAFRIDDIPELHDRIIAGKA